MKSTENKEMTKVCSFIIFDIKNPSRTQCNHKTLNKPFCPPDSDPSTTQSSKTTTSHPFYWVVTRVLSRASSPPPSPTNPKPVPFHNQLILDFMLSVTTIMKTVIGAGIISLPSTISKLGYVFGVFMYLLVVLINHFTAMMLLKSKNLSRHSNYSSIMRHLFNSNAAKAICSLLILYKNVGMCIIELTIIKQAVHQIASEIWEGVGEEFYVS